MLAQEHRVLISVDNLLEAVASYNEDSINSLVPNEISSH
jgi:hypothetical protein